MRIPSCFNISTLVVVALSISCDASRLGSHEQKSDRDDRHVAISKHHVENLVEKEYIRDESKSIVEVIDAHTNKDRVELACDSDEQLLVLKLRTDSYGYETSFEILTVSGIFASEPPDDENLEDNTLYTYTYCVKIGKQYRVIVKDQAKDGLCCGYGKGTYSIKVGDEVLFDSKELKTFTDEGRKTFRVKAPPQTPSINNTSSNSSNSNLLVVGRPTTSNSDIPNTTTNNRPTTTTTTTYSTNTINTSNTSSNSAGSSISGLLFSNNRPNTSNSDRPNTTTNSRPTTTTTTYSPNTINTSNTSSNSAGSHIISGRSDSGCMTVKVKADNEPQELSWRILNTNGNQVASSDPMEALQPVSKTVCLSSGEYTWVIQDSYGDGLCCSQGQGYYTVYMDGREIIHGTYFLREKRYKIQVDPPYEDNMSARDRDWLESHNSRREKYHGRWGADYVPLKWSPTLAEQARVWANKLLDDCDVNGIEHEKGIAEGENLAKNRGSGSFGELYTTENILNRWVEDELTVGYPANAHMTQCLWRASRYLGCGEAVREGFNNGRGTCRVQVCRYARAGNCNMKQHSATIGQNWMHPVLQDRSRCTPECAPEGCW